MKVFQLFDDKQIEQAVKQIAKCEFTDGKLSALGDAKRIKKNRQIPADDPNIIPLLNDIKVLLFQNSIVNGYANIKGFAGLRVVSYQDGGHYGWHVDMAHMDLKRTDLSFTLFLSDESEYQGGDLQMDYGSHKVTVRGKKGQIVIYPTGVLHQVTPVTKGERLCVVGWIESLIPNEDDRQAVWNLMTAIRDVKQLEPPQSVVDQLNYSLQFLKRRVSL
jgi:PKHD-type hydroxylase